MTLNFQELQRACAEMADSTAFPHGLRDWSLTQWTNALAGETGELCNFAKKVERDEVNYDVDMGKELADIVIYAAIIAEYIGVNLHQKFCSAFEELKCVIPRDLRSRGLTDWTNMLAARTGFLCYASECDHEDSEEMRSSLFDIVAKSAVVAEYIGVDLGEEVRKKFNEVSEKRGVDIKL